MISFISYIQGKAVDYVTRDSYIQININSYLFIHSFSGNEWYLGMGRGGDGGAEDLSELLKCLCCFDGVSRLWGFGCDLSVNN